MVVGKGWGSIWFSIAILYLPDFCGSPKKCERMAALSVRSWPGGCYYSRLFVCEILLHSMVLSTDLLRVHARMCVCVCPFSN